jgi:hypothetical protein
MRPGLVNANAILHSNTQSDGLLLLYCSCFDSSLLVIISFSTLVVQTGYYSISVDVSIVTGSSLTLDNAAASFVAI